MDKNLYVNSKKKVFKRSIQNTYSIEIKPFELGSRIRDVEAFWYKTEIKIIYFVRLYVIVMYGLPWP